MDLSQTVSDLYKESFDLIATEFDAMLSDIENRSNMLDAYISQIEERGYLVSTKYYKELLDNEQKNITLLQQEYSALQSSLAEAVASGAVKEGSESWYEMKASIDEVALSIQEAVNQTIEYNNAIRDIEWEVFDFLQEQISGITNEADFLIDLMSNSDMYDDKGNITDEGLATMGMHGVNYNTYMEQARQYEEEMLRIQDELANDPNNTVLIERRNELLELQRESILAAEDEKQAIEDLVSEGIEKELEAVKKLIDTYTESLDSAKDLYNYQKSVEEQVKNISALEKQISATEGDLSEENRANLQQLRNELKEAQENLEETEYERYISDQKQLLDELYDNYETTLNMRLDDLDALIAACIDGINTNSSSINETLERVTSEVGYNLSENMNIIFGTDGILGANGAIATTITTFSGDFATRMTTLQTAIDAILNTVKSMIAESEEEATEDIAEVEQVMTPELETPATAPSGSIGNSGAGSSNANGSGNLSSEIGGNNLPEVGDVVTYTGEYMYSAVGTRPVGSLYSGKNKGVVIKQIQPDSRWYHPTHPYLIGPADKQGGVFGWVSLDQLHGYKTGTFNLPENEFALVDEGYRKELVINPDGSMRMPDGSILTPLAKGSSVLNAAATENFYKFANDPTGFLQGIGNSAGNITPPVSGAVNDIHNEIHVSCVFPNVSTYEEFMYKLQHDTKAEKMIKDITLGAISGQNSLNKYRHNYKL